MKAIRLSAFLCILASLNVYSQDEVHLQMAYRPGMKYNQYTINITQTELRYSGSRKVLKELKAQGIENPAIQKSETNSETVFTTGKLTDSIHFPVEITYVSSFDSDGDQSIPDGTRIFGQASLGNLPVLDSVASEEMKEEFKSQVLKTLQNTISQLSLPEKRLKIGETYTKETPVTIPLEGLPLEMVITTSYTLTGREKGNAIFLIEEVYKIKSSTQVLQLKASGSGKGKMLYDIANGFFVRYEMENKLIMKMDVSEFSVDVKMKTNMLLTNEISQNATASNQVRIRF